MIKKTMLFIIGCMTVLTAQDGIQTNIPPQNIAGGGAVYFMNPQWSPDGTMLAFSGSNYQGLFVLNIQDNNQVRLSGETGVGFGYSWSNDGNSILVRGTKTIDRKDRNALKLIDVNTGSETVLVDYQSKISSIPQWSVDNSQIIFQQNRAVQKINTGKLAKRTGPSKVCYLESGKIKITSPGTDQPTVLNPIPKADYLGVRLSPDGNFISFEVMGGNLYTMRSDGTELTDLGRGYRAQWSPDSEYLVYMITEDDGHEFTASDIFIIKRDGTASWQLTDTIDKFEMNPSWSPAGDKIAYNDYLSGKIYIQSLSN